MIRISRKFRNPERTARLCRDGPAQGAGTVDSSHPRNALIACPCCVSGSTAETILFPQGLPGFPGATRFALRPAPGGHGAAREFCDLLLVASGRYAQLLESFS